MLNAASFNASSLKLVGNGGDEAEAAPVWVPDSDAERCMCCACKFTAFRRRVCFFYLLLLLLWFIIIIIGLLMVFCSITVESVERWCAASARIIRTNSTTSTRLSVCARSASRTSLRLLPTLFLPFLLLTPSTIYQSLFPAWVNPLQLQRMQEGLWPSRWSVLIVLTTTRHYKWWRARCSSLRHAKLTERSSTTSQVLWWILGKRKIAAAGNMHQLRENHLCLLSLHFLLYLRAHRGPGLTYTMHHLPCHYYQMDTDNLGQSALTAPNLSMIHGGVIEEARIHWIPQLIWV